MNIVVLDGYTLNPGDLSWDELNELGRVTVYDRTAPDEVIARAQDADIVLTNKTALTAELLGQLPNLRYIGVLATGYNVVDIEAASSRQIIVSNVPDYSTYSVVQLVFAFILEHCHRLAEHSSAVHGGKWSSAPDFTFSLHPLQELAGKTLGLIGFGQIGRQVARAALAFGMNVIVSTRTRNVIDGLENVSYVELDDLFRRSDFISLHCPLTEQTKGLVHARRLSLMKPSAFLINTARGGHVVEADLAHALRNGQLAGAGLDVLSVEPPPQDHPLLHVPNCWITPHIGWATMEARGRLLQIATDNIRAFQAGTPTNRVDVR
ncbi:glycerate dehydrogenase [Paenibacillus phyllosphaerae]|uniref:Glycerate dehydrogenase n=1 Tax=Paenibacillus phyllosphaerae TaxID=274593 RepID=A0A7W5AWC9_9BACL|nr:D-2-hydroxyacid dehydrogenase [Paenibacillus phyllosphaerae]MBB3109341.1 glycerate dehydrogenase [Paenibacillus phyllosphaerae]